MTIIGPKMDAIEPINYGHKWLNILIVHQITMEIEFSQEEKP